MAAGASAQHGRRYTYQRGCRCEDCRQANTDYARDWYQVRVDSGNRPKRSRDNKKARA